MFFELSGIKANIRSLRIKIRRAAAIQLFDRHRPSAPISQFKKVIFVRWDGKIGDSIVSSFVYRELKKSYPNIEISIIGPQSLRSLFIEHYQCDRYYVSSNRPSYSKIRQLCRSIGKIDLLVNLTATLKMRDIYFMHRCQATHCAGTDDTLETINLKLGKHLQTSHFETIYGELLRACGIPKYSSQYMIPKSNKSEAKAEQFLRDIQKPIIAFNPYGHKNKSRLSQFKALQVIESLRVRHNNATICVIAEPSKSADASELCAAFDAGVLKIWEDCSMYDVIAIIRRCQLVVSVDTSIAHIAKGLNKPMLVLFPQKNSESDNWAYSKYSRGINLYPPGQTTQSSVNNISQAQLEQAIATINVSDVSHF